MKNIKLIKTNKWKINYNILYLKMLYMKHQSKIRDGKALNNINVLYTHLYFYLDK